MPYIIVTVHLLDHIKNKDVRFKLHVAVDDDTISVLSDKLKSHLECIYNRSFRIQVMSGIHMVENEELPLTSYLFENGTSQLYFFAYELLELNKFK